MAQHCVSIQNVVADQWGLIANSAQRMCPFCTSTISTPSCGFNDVHTYVYAFETGSALSSRVVDVHYAAPSNLNKVLYGLRSLKFDRNRAYREGRRERKRGPIIHTGVPPWASAGGVDN